MKTFICSYFFCAIQNIVDLVVTKTVKLKFTEEECQEKDKCSSESEADWETNELTNAVPFERWIDKCACCYCINTIKPQIYPS